MSDDDPGGKRSEEHTSELQSPVHSPLSLHDALPIWLRAPSRIRRRRRTSCPSKHEMELTLTGGQFHQFAMDSSRIRNARVRGFQAGIVSLFIQNPCLTTILEGKDRKSTRLNSSHPSIPLFPYTTLFRSGYAPLPVSVVAEERRVLQSMKWN